MLTHPTHAYKESSRDKKRLVVRRNRRNNHDRDREHQRRGPAKLAIQRPNVPRVPADDRRNAQSSNSQQKPESRRCQLTKQR